MQRAARVSPFASLSSALKALHPLRFAHAHERETLFVATLGLSALYLTALISFSPLDVSLVAMVIPPQPAQNLAGAFGANLAGMAIFLFGAVAWFLPLPLMATSSLVLRNSPAAASRQRWYGWILAFASALAIVSMRHPEVTWRGFDFPSGGAIGSTLSDYLFLWFGRIGAWIAVLTISLCALLLILRRSLLTPASLWIKEELATVLKDLRLRRESLANTPAVNSVIADSFDTSAATVATHPIANLPPEPLVHSFENSAVEPPQSWDDHHLLVPPTSAAPAAAAQPNPGVRATKTPGIQASTYVTPPLSVFNKADATSASTINPKDLEATANLLVKTFEDFGVQGKVIGYQPGPVVTVFEFQPDAGVKQSKIVGLIDDLALALKVDSIFIHPVRGKRALGVQVPNSKREAVHLGDILATSTFKDCASPLTFGMGKTITGQPMCADLTAMPHLLVAGATGSGKSVCINSMLSSIIMKATPDEVRMILVDPKMLELSIYEGIPHLLMPVITEPAKASLALKWAAAEMERRYKLMQLACVRNIAGFNEFWTKATAGRQAELRAAVGDETLTRLPYILLVIDELADLMMTAPKDVESSIQRLAQKARASGIHMVLATQRPSVDIITGVIKANLPCRVAFQVVSKHDSRTILDLIGAEKLLGKGDMLLQRPGIGRLERLQGALITDEEVLNLVATVKATSPVHYDKNIINWIDDEFARQKTDEGSDSDADIMMDDDPKFEEAMALARAHGVVSASFLQRHLKIGYNRAARIVEFMESRGYVDKADGAKPRKWLGPMGAA